MIFRNIFVPLSRSMIQRKQILSLSLLKKCKSTFFLFCLGHTAMIAQSSSNRFFSSGSEIVADVLPGNDIYYCHVYDRGIPIYDLAEVFHIKPEKVMKANKLLPNQPINDGKIVKIPISRDCIILNPNFKPGKQPHLALVYIVRKGETLYRIAHEYFDTDTKALLTINQKDHHDVRPGEKLLIGWILLPKPSKTSETKKEIPVFKSIEKNNPSPVAAEKKIKSEPAKLNPVQQQPTALAETKIIKYYLSDVIGRWDKSSDGNESFFALHNEAKPGSMMDIYNPMLKKHVKAKVLGKIPAGTYQSDVEIFISQSVAKALGLLDTRYKVNIKFEKSSQ